MDSSYHRDSDDRISDLIAPKTPNIGIWGQRHRKYLKEADKSAAEIFDRLIKVNDLGGCYEQYSQRSGRSYQRRTIFV